MLQLVVKDKQTDSNRYDYLIYTYVDNRCIISSQPTLGRAMGEAPKAHFTSKHKADQVNALFKLTEDSSTLREFWESL